MNLKKQLQNILFDKIREPKVMEVILISRIFSNYILYY